MPPVAAKAGRQDHKGGLQALHGIRTMTWPNRSFVGHPLARHISTTRDWGKNCGTAG